MTGRTRPLGVAIIALFLVLDAAITVVDVSGQLPAAASRIAGHEAADTLQPIFLFGAVLKVLAAIGLWRRSWRAWALTMVLVGLSLVSDLYVYWVLEPRYISMVVDVLIAFYLNQGVVRDYFEHRDLDPAEPARAP